MSGEIGFVSDSGSGNPVSDWLFEMVHDAMQLFDLGHGVCFSFSKGSGEAGLVAVKIMFSSGDVFTKELPNAFTRWEWVMDTACVQDMSRDAAGNVVPWDQRLYGYFPAALGRRLVNFFCESFTGRFRLWVHDLYEDEGEIPRLAFAYKEEFAEKRIDVEEGKECFGIVKAWRNLRHNRISNEQLEKCPVIPPGVLDGVLGGRLVWKLFSTVYVREDDDGEDMDMSVWPLHVEFMGYPWEIDVAVEIVACAMFECHRRVRVEGLFNLVSEVRRYTREIILDVDSPALREFNRLKGANT